MKQFQIMYKERTQTEDRPGFRWYRHTALVTAASKGAALLSLYYKKNVITPIRVVELE